MDVDDKAVVAIWALVGEVTDGIANEADPDVPTVDDDVALFATPEAAPGSNLGLMLSHE